MAFQHKDDPCRNDIIEHLYRLIQAEPDIAAYSFGLARQGAHIYITVKDEDELRTFDLVLHGNIKERK